MHAQPDIMLEDSFFLCEKGVIIAFCMNCSLLDPASELEVLIESKTFRPFRFGSSRNEPGGSEGIQENDEG